VLADRRTHVVRLDENRGAAGARNVGIERSSGPFIAFLDDDDEWLPTKLECQVPTLAGEPESVGAVECGYEMYDGDRLAFRYVPLPKPELTTTVLERPTLQASTLLMRRTVFETIGLFDPTLLRIEDWELWLRFANRFAVASMPDVLVSRRLNVLPVDQTIFWSATMLELLRPHIEKLPAAARRRVLAWHEFDKGMHLVEAGSPTSGMRSMLRAWRMNPASVTYLIRALMAPSPPVARAATRAARFGRRLGRRFRGRDEFARRW
jgi:glycosyltransferase involved in cell wall biosynthesis